MTKDDENFDDIESVLDSQDRGEQTLAARGLERRPGFAFMPAVKDKNGTLRMAPREMMTLPARTEEGKKLWESQSLDNLIKIQRMHDRFDDEMLELENRKRVQLGLQPKQRRSDEENAQTNLDELGLKKSSMRLGKPSKGEIESFNMEFDPAGSNF